MSISYSFLEIGSAEKTPNSKSKFFFSSNQNQENLKLVPLLKKLVSLSSSSLAPTEDSHMINIEGEEDEFLIPEEFAQLGDVSNKRMRFIVVNEKEQRFHRLEPPLKKKKSDMITGGKGCVADNEGMVTIVEDTDRHIFKDCSNMFAPEDSDSEHGFFIDKEGSLHGSEKNAKHVMLKKPSFKRC